mmetsp:Transcript_12458/g.30218  ORF Transcript_12458/g.30218 Transcript_12458/m.30218 type:complete len:203 (+) Transcript_12458:1405-2013(+)
MSPDEPWEASPVLRYMEPDDPTAPASTVPTVMSPLPLMVLLPLSMTTLPPFPPYVLPAAKTRSPPTSSEPWPLPSPPLIKTSPPLPPLEVSALDPVPPVRRTSPPLNPAAVAIPAPMRRSPPSLRSSTPTCMRMSVASPGTDGPMWMMDPFSGLPARRMTAPDLSVLDKPDAIRTEPVCPVVAAPVSRVMPPLIPLVTAPVL